MSDGKAVLVWVDKGLLGRMMQLPEDVFIETIREDSQRPDDVEIRLVGEGLPKQFCTSSDGLVPHANPTLRGRIPFWEKKEGLKWEW